MATRNPIGYCNHCQQNVLLKREDIDMCLAIILLLFTAGIGLIIYLLIHYSKPENRCVHCGSICQVVISNQYPQSSDQLPYQQQVQSNQIPYQPQSQIQYRQETIQADTIIEVKGGGALYCPLCGEKLDNPGVRFCPSCGSKV
ncbi:MAG: zinc-ribbon domain-containing protein [Promethearchaeota archaeon]